MSQNFPQVYGHSGRNVKNETDLCSYAMKTNLKGAQSIDASTLTSKMYSVGS